MKCRVELLFRSVGGRDQQPTGFVLPPLCFCNNKELTRLQRALVFKVYCSVLFRTVSTINSVFNCFNDSKSSYVRRPSSLDYILRSHFESSNKFIAMSSMNYRKTLNMSTYATRLVIMVGNCRCWLPPAVWFGTFSVFENDNVVYIVYSNFGEGILFNLNAILESLRRQSTDVICLMLFCSVLNKLILSQK